MATDNLNVNEYLKPRDVETLPQRRGREASGLYSGLVEGFVSSGEAAMEVNVKKINRKPATVRSALAKAIKDGGLKEKVRVSLLGDEVILRLR